ncbi:hypothetical protein [Cumulibacter manganitolerans]|uniref:hypothetical protein n=1 Tax=Cumulibacter manganitolerans TaxID=1884992 RepID=UPI001296CA2A|nr:hypothetical protein [Cumulibacter manganitolerans]
MSELEDDLRATLARHARDAFPDDRPVPPLDLGRPGDPVGAPGSDGGWRRSRIALLAGAAVIGIAVGVGTFAAQHRETRPAGPGGVSRSSGPGGVSQSSAPRETTQSTQPSTATASSASSTAAAVQYVPGVYGGAQIPIPPGFQVAKSPTGDPARVCLGDDGSTCTIEVVSRQETVDADTDGGYASDPQYCPPASGGSRSLSGYESFQSDGHPVEYRGYHWVCADGTSVDTATFVTVGKPTYVLFSEHATPAVVAAMKEALQQAKLPARQGDLRTYDYGIVTAVTPSADGSVTIALDRAVPSGGDGPVNNNPATYDYRIPATTTRPTVGDTVKLYTDGETVTDCLVLGR